MLGEIKAALTYLRHPPPKILDALRNVDVLSVPPDSLEIGNALDGSPVQNTVMSTASLPGAEWFGDSHVKIEFREGRV
jgi:hypothetical protein